MNVFHLFDEIAAVDADVYDRFDTRRKVMRQFANVGRKLTAASLPVAFGAMFQKAYGQVPSQVIDVLNFALTQEYLEIEVYTTGYNSVTFPDTESKTAIGIVIDHEHKHAKFLQDTIRSLGGAPIAKPRFDVTGGSGSMNGPFKDAYKDFAFYLGVVQVFEDTGVRAYKGQAPRLLGTGDVLTGALRIHSMEARHAAKLREMRKKYAGADVKPWITFSEPGLGDKNPLVAKNYAGETNSLQAGIEIVGINGYAEIGLNEATESFDEPLTKEQVLEIVKPFIVG